MKAVKTAAVNVNIHHCFSNWNKENLLQIYI